MQKKLTDFIEATIKINQVLAELADIGLEKKELIIANEVKEIDSLIRKESIIVSNLSRFETARFKLQESLADSWEMPVADLSASVLLEKVQANYGELAGELANELHHLNLNLTRLKSINKQNNELIEQSLDYIDSMQALLDGDVAGTYSSLGEKQDETSSKPSVNLLDKKV